MVKTIISVVPSLCLNGFFSEDTGHKDKIKSTSPFVHFFIHSLIYSGVTKIIFVFGPSGSLIMEGEEEGVDKPMVSVPSRATRHMDEITGGAACCSGIGDKGLPEIITCA